MLQKAFRKEVESYDAIGAAWTLAKMKCTHSIGLLKHLKSEIDGVFKVSIPNTKKVVKDLNKLCKKDSSLFNHTFHWVPIEKWVKANIKEMQKEIKKFNKGIKKTEKWMMDLNKRHYAKEGTTELILKLTDVIDKPKVDLKNPQKIVKVEIIGNKAGLALLGIDELLSVPKK